MSTDDTSRVTQILADANVADSSDIAAKLLPLVYQELRELAARRLRMERQGHSLQPTALVHEAFLRVVDQSRVDWKGKTHFFAVCAQAMRRILIDHDRARRRAKRGGDWRRVALENVTLPELSIRDVRPEDLKDALETLASLDRRQAKVVELRFFSGLTMQEIASFFGVSKRTVENDWMHARAWLRLELSQANGS